MNLQYLPARTVQLYTKSMNKEIPQIRMDLADLLRIYPPDGAVDIQKLLSFMEPIRPRLYSIASSPAAHGDNEVHITVSRIFLVDEQKRFGLCSDFLRSLKRRRYPDVYVQKNNSFRLPEPSADMIMIGPGTGINSIPFLLNAMRNQLVAATGFFFGEQHFVSDFFIPTDLPRA